MNLDFGMTLLRLVVGLLFIGHGSQKLFGAFNGPGLKGASGYFGMLRVRQPVAMATLVSLSELLGGACLVLGLATPLACAAIAGVMLGAIFLAHWPKFWITEEGMEYALTNLAIVTFFGIAGPGGWSLDEAIGTEGVLPNPQTYLVALTFAALGAAMTLVQRRPAAAESQREHRAAA
jgi:putative oxidoreductase